MAKNLNGKLHYHACVHCKGRYPDACQSSLDNGTCGTCRQGRLSVHQLGTNPSTCCPNNVRVANKDDIETYRLRGKGPWWICMTCARTFGHDIRIRND